MAVEPNDAASRNPQLPLGGNTAPSFNFPAYVRYDSVTGSRDLGRGEDLRVLVTGTVGSESGSSTLFFRFTATKPAFITLRLETSNKWTDRFLQLSILDENRNSLTLNEKGRVVANEITNTLITESSEPSPAGTYTICLSSSQWQSTKFAFFLGVNAQVRARGALVGTNRLLMKIKAQTARLFGNLKGSSRLGSGEAGLVLTVYTPTPRPIGPARLTGQGRLAASVMSAKRIVALPATSSKGAGGLGAPLLTVDAPTASMWVSKATAGVAFTFAALPSICITSDRGSLQAFRYASSSGTTTHQFAFVKRNAQGDILWSRVSTGSFLVSSNHQLRLFPCSNGNVIFYMDPYGSDGTVALAGCLVGCISSAGALLYCNLYSLLSNISQIAVQPSTGNLVFMGAVGTTAADIIPAWMILAPTTGTLVSARTIPRTSWGFSGYIFATAVLFRSNGRALVFGAGATSAGAGVTFVTDTDVSLATPAQTYRYGDGTSKVFDSVGGVTEDLNSSIYVWTTGRFLKLNADLSIASEVSGLYAPLTLAGDPGKPAKTDSSGVVHIVGGDYTTGAVSLTSFDANCDIVYRKTPLLPGTAFTGGVNADFSPSGRYVVTTISDLITNTPTSIAVVGQEMDLGSTSLTNSGSTFLAGTEGQLPSLSIETSALTQASSSFTLATATVTTTAYALTLSASVGTLAWQVVKTANMATFNSYYPQPTFPSSPAVDPDPYLSYVTLHLPMSGMLDTANFRDYSVSPKVVTGYGNARLSKAQALFPDLGGTYETVSALLDGTGDYLTAPSGDAFVFGTGNFTIETWLYLKAADGILFDNTSTGATSGAAGSFYWYVNSNRQLGIVANGLELASGPSPRLTVPLNTWCHVALARDQEVWRLFVNGVADKNAYRLKVNLTNSGCWIGRMYSTTTRMLNGHLQDFRITKGIARYVKKFTPRTTAIQYTPYVPPAITLPSEPAQGAASTLDQFFSNTALLLRMNGSGTAFVDSGVYGLTVSRFGDTTQGTGGKWGGNRGVFDGAGDYLFVTTTAGGLGVQTGDFTIDLWATRQGEGEGAGFLQYLLDSRTAEPGTLALRVNTAATGRQICVTYNSIIVIAGPSMELNIRYHIAVCRSARVMRLFVNGLQVGGDNVNTYTSSVNLTVGRGAVQVDGSYGHFHGSLNDVRVIPGVALYKSNFTPPTSALPAQGGTGTSATDLLYDYTAVQLLMNSADGTTNGANIVDTSGIEKTITNNGVVLNSTIFKYGNASAVFNGTSSYLSIAGVDVIRASTIELWFYLTQAVSGSYCLVARGVPNSYAFYLGLTSTGILFSTSNLSYTAPVALSVGRFYHIALTNSVSGNIGAGTKIWLDGSLLNTSTAPFNSLTGATTSSIFVGASPTASTSMQSYFKGYIDFLRISQIIRYAAPFTPPIQPA